MTRSEKILATVGVVLLLAIGGGGAFWLTDYVVGSTETAKKRTDDIREQGYKSGLLGFPRETCPYEDRWDGEPRRAIWLAGWADGKIQAIWWQRGH